MGAEAVDAMVTGVQWTLAIGLTAALIVWGARIIVDFISDATRG
jgi:hypothetical protein